MAPRTAKGPALAALAATLLALAWATVSVAAAVAPPPNVPVTDTALRAYQGPWLAVDPREPDELAVAFQDGNSFPTCWLGLSGDGGESWEQIPVVGGPESIQQLPPGYYICFRPTLSVASDGTIHLAYVTGQGGIPGPDAIYLVSSEDGGESFGEPVPINTAPLAPGNAGDGAARVAVDPASGRLYVAWRQAKGIPQTAQDLLVASSADGGQTFSAPVQVNTSDFNVGTPTVDVGRDGRIYVTYPVTPRAGSDPARPMAIQVATSTDGGASFGAPVTAQEEFNCSLRGQNTCAPNDAFRFEGRNTNGPHLVAGRLPGEAYLVSYGLEGGIGDDLFRIRLSVTRDGGASWSRARTIGIPAGAEAHHQITPSISRSPGGRLDVAFYDLATPSHLENTYVITSIDGGRSFGAPRLLSSVPSDTDIRPSLGFGQGPVAGSRLVASTDEFIHSAWTDSRRGEPESAKLDIFSASVSLVSDPVEPFESDEDDEPASAFAGCSATATAVIQGTAARDALVGTLAPDRIFADAGGDLVEALGGGDCIDLGPGADVGHGASGADLIVGGPGRDRLLGSSGADRVRGGAGDDRLSGGRGRDRVLGGAGRDSLAGGGLRDRLAGGAGNDRLRGDSGADVLTGASGADRLRGGSGADRISGGSGADRISGGSGPDRLSGRSGADRISARDGHQDRITCGRGQDAVAADRFDRVVRDCERVRRLG